MPRIRTIKPEFWDSEKLARLDFGARLLFIGLWNFADDSGRLRGGVSWISGKVLPYDPKAPVEAWLKALEGIGAIRRYSVAEEAYIEIPNFLKHQRIEKPSESRLPPFREDSGRIPGGVAPGKEQGTGKGTGSREVEEEGGPPAAAGEPPAQDPGVEIAGTPYRIPGHAWGAWKLAFPGVELLPECRKAAAWEASNPKNRKVDKVRFLHNWLARAQDDLTKGRGGAVGSGRAPLRQPGAQVPLSDAERARDERYARESEERLAKMRAERAQAEGAPKVPGAEGIGKPVPRGCDEVETARRRTEALARLGVRA